MPNRGMLGFYSIVCAFLFTQGAPALYSQARAQTRIVSNSELVRVPVIVFDDKGNMATDLTKEDFRLFEDGVEQQIVSYDLERVPVSFVVLADLSSSMTAKLPFVQALPFRCLTLNRMAGRAMNTPW